jgi:hypothetical protein
MNNGSWTMRMFILTLSALAASGSAGVAEDLTRYTLEKTSDGYVRMDKSTGEMSICKEQGDQLVCRIAADDRMAIDDEMAGLEKRLAAVEGKLGMLEKSGLKSGPSLPTDEEFEKTMSYMEKFFRRFMGVVKELNDEDNGPQKT